MLKQMVQRINTVV